MTRKLVQFAVCYFEVALILFVVEGADETRELIVAID